jgi:hypothetical protein
MNRKIFSAYVGLDFESMHLNDERASDNGKKATTTTTTMGKQ